MDFKRKIERIFNLKPDSTISGYPGGKTTHINDSYSSLIFVLIEYLEKEFENENITEESIIKGVENYLNLAKYKLQIIKDEVHINDLDNYYSELISFTNQVIEVLNYYFDRYKLKPIETIFKIPKTKFLEIVINDFSKFRDYLLTLKSKKEFNEVQFDHFTINNGKIIWTAQLPFLGVILNNVCNVGKYDFNNAADYIRYFLNENPLINIGALQNRTLQKNINLFKSYKFKSGEKKLVDQYTEVFIDLDKKRNKK